MRGRRSVGGSAGCSDIVKKGFRNTDHLVGDVTGRVGLLVLERRQRDVSPLQETLILVRFAELHAHGDAFLSQFLQEVEMRCRSQKEY